MSVSTGRDFVVAHPEIQELARQWAAQPEPLSEAGFKPLYPLVEKILRAALIVEGESVDGLTLIQLLQRCCSDRLRFLNLEFICCDARGRKVISNVRSAVIHADYSHDMAELREGGWTGTEADYQKILHHRLHTMYVMLNYVVQQIDQQTGRFLRKWQPNRALCPACKATGLTI
jgi:hypothetical protein